MPVIPQPNSNGIVRSLGFSFNFSNAFTSTAQIQGIPVNTSFSTLQTSLGTSSDLFPTQQTAWGRANQGAIGFSTLTTPSGVGQLGTVGDAPALLTSLWAYAKITYEDAQTAAANANLAYSLANTATETLNTILSPDAAGAVGTSTDTPSLTTSLWAYAQQAESDAQFAIGEAATANSWITTESTPDAVNAIGTYSDAPDVNTSLWALAKQAEADAQSALIKTSFGNCSFSTIFTPFVRSLDSNSVIALPDNGVGNTLLIGTFSNDINIAGGGNLDISCGGAGYTSSLTSLATPLLNINVGNSSGTTGQVLGSDGAGYTVWQGVPGNVGTSNDVPSLTNTLWAYAKQAEVNAQTGITTANRALNYTLTGSNIAAVITNPKGTGSGNAWTQNAWYQVSQIVFNIPPNWTDSYSVFFDGWLLYNFQSNVNVSTYWGVSYFTNTYATPTDILGSTTTAADSLYYPLTSQQYIATNLIIPPTNLTTGGTITLRVYGLCGSTGTNYLSVAPVISGRVGLALA